MPPSMRRLLDLLRGSSAAGLGGEGENAAARFLEQQGFVILERNRLLGPYEIDIIAQEVDTIAFVEVKTRRTGDPVPPESNVDRRKRRHIRRAARVYIDERDDPTMYYRFDVVSVVVPASGPCRIELFRDAFPDED